MILPRHRADRQRITTSNLEETLGELGKLLRTAQAIINGLKAAVEESKICRFGEPEIQKKASVNTNYGELIRQEMRNYRGTDRAAMHRELAERYRITLRQVAAMAAWNSPKLSRKRRDS